MPTVKDDFDRIALVSGKGWNHNSHYHAFLLAHAPSRCEQALDVDTLAKVLGACELELADTVLAALPELYRRYVLTC